MLLILVSNVQYHELKLKKNKQISFVFLNKNLLMPEVFQKPIGGTNRSTRRGVSKAGRFVLLKFNELVGVERITEGSSLTLQINAPFNP